jgi:hypothetical protein
MTTPSGFEREGAGEKISRQRKTPQAFKLPLAKTGGLGAVRFVLHIVAIVLQASGVAQTQAAFAFVCDI